MKDYYSILKISRSANSVEIKAAYRNLSKQFHPDVNKASNASLVFIEIKEAYEVLIDDARRVHYNQLLDYSSKQQYQQINIIPKITFFYCDNGEFSVGEVITFTWEVLDADLVELRPFGKVQNSGTKKIKITEVSENLLVELFCYNSISRNYLISQMILKKRDVVYPYIMNNQSTIFESVDQNHFLNLKKEGKSKDIKIFDVKINRPDGLEIVIMIYAFLNLFVYLSYPFFFIKETKLEAIRAFSKTEKGFTDYFIEFENFNLNVTREIAENLQAMDQRNVFFGFSTPTNDLAYYRIQIENKSITQEVLNYNNVGNFTVLYFLILILQFYFIFMKEKKRSDDKFGFVLGFFFMFSIAMSYVLYSNLF